MKVVVLALSLAVAARADWWPDDECVDGGVAITRKGKTKGCNWVGKNADRCTKTGTVSSGVSCAKACGTGQTDSLRWRDARTGDDCYWVSKKPNNRCDRDGTDTAGYGCRATCNGCHEQMCQEALYPSKVVYENCPAVAIDADGTMATYVKLERDTVALCADSACGQCQVIGASSLFFELAGGLENNIEGCTRDPVTPGLYWKMTTGTDDTDVTALYYEVFKDEDCEIPENDNADFFCTTDTVGTGPERNCLFDPGCFCAGHALQGFSG